MILHEATDCQHTDHYPKQSKAVLLSSTPQGSQLNNLGNPTESRNSPEPMAAPFQIHYLVSSQSSPMVLNSKGTVTHLQSESSTQLKPEANKPISKIVSGCMSIQTTIVPRPVKYLFSHQTLYSMFEKMSFDIIDLLFIYFKIMFYAADLELSMVTNVMASGELIISELSYVVGIIELYLFWSTIINYFSQKRQKNMVGVQRILVVRIKDCKMLNNTYI